MGPLMMATIASLALAVPGTVSQWNSEIDVHWLGYYGDGTRQYYSIRKVEDSQQGAVNACKYWGFELLSFVSQDEFERVVNLMSETKTNVNGNLYLNTTRHWTADVANGVCITLYGGQLSGESCKLSSVNGAGYRPLCLQIVDQGPSTEQPEASTSNYPSEQPGSSTEGWWYGTSEQPESSTEGWWYGTSEQPASSTEGWWYGTSEQPASSTEGWWYGTSEQPASSTEGWWYGTSEQPASSTEGWWYGTSEQPASSTEGWWYGTSEQPASSTDNYQWWGTSEQPSSSSPNYDYSGTSESSTGHCLNEDRYYNALVARRFVDSLFNVSSFNDEAVSSDFLAIVGLNLQDPEENPFTYTLPEFKRNFVQRLSTFGDVDLGTVQRKKIDAGASVGMEPEFTLAGQRFYKRFDIYINCEGKVEKIVDVSRFYGRRKFELALNKAASG